MKNLIKGVLAGIEISLGGTAFLACDNKYIGALLFSIALLCICYREDTLYTGKICYLVQDTSVSYIKILLAGILGNLIGTVGCGICARVMRTDLIEKAKLMCGTKLELSFAQVLLKGVFCGILIFLAVDIFKENKTPLAIFLCIPSFILSGFEHCIADMFYFTVSGRFSIDVVLFIFIVIIGNSIGGCIFPIFKRFTKI